MIQRTRGNHIKGHWGLFSDCFERYLTKQHLRGRLVLRPGLKFQKVWAGQLSPELRFEDNIGSWRLLQRFVLPLIFEHGSHYHCLGIQSLGLDRDEPPEFNDFCSLVYEAYGWSITLSEGELSAQDFFELLSRKKIPCVRQLRPIAEVFAASKPDFWHEAIGHIAVLGNSEASDFYQWCGSLISGLYREGYEQIAKDTAGILWVLMEYGLIIEGNETKSFGAALTGSYMGLQRFRGGYIFPESNWTCEAILQSRLHIDGATLPRNRGQEIILYAMTDLAETKEKLEKFIIVRKQNSKKGE